MKRGENSVLLCLSGKVAVKDTYRKKSLARSILDNKFKFELSP